MDGLVQDPAGPEPHARLPDEELVRPPHWAIQVEQAPVQHSETHRHGMPTKPAEGHGSLQV